MSNVMGMFGSFVLLAGAGTSVFLAVNGLIARTHELPVVPQQFAITTPPQPGEARVLPSPRPDVFYEAITDRPLFAPSRRPEMISEVVAIEEPKQIEEILRPENLVLSGVLGGTPSRSAFISVGGLEGEWFRTNDEIEGWAITDIGPDAITLTDGNDSFRLELFE